MDTVKYIRDLGGNEQFTDCCMVHRNLCMAASATLDPIKKVTLPDLEKAVRRWQSEHLELQSTVKRGGRLPVQGFSVNPMKWGTTPKPVPKPEFWTVHEHKLPIQWITVKNDDSWRTDILEAVLQVTFREGALLWRVYWAESEMTAKEGSESTKIGTLILNVHPAIADLRGTNLLLDELLDHVDQVLRGDERQLNEAVMHESLEAALDPHVAHVTWKDKLFFGKMMLSGFSSWTGAWLTSNPLPLVPDFTTRHLAFEVSAMDSALILNALKKHDLSLHAFVTAAAAISMHKALNVSDGTAVKLWTTHEANLRSCCKNFEISKGRIHGCMCNYIEDSLITTGDSSREGIWALTQSVQGSITAKLRSDYPAIMGKMCFNMLGSPYAFFTKLAIERNTRNDYAVVVQDDLDDIIKPREAFKIQSLFASVAAHNMGTPFKYLLAVHQNQLYFNVCYYASLSTQEKAMELGHKTLALIKKACT